MTPFNQTERRLGNQIGVTMKTPSIFSKPDGTTFSRYFRAPSIIKQSKPLTQFKEFNLSKRPKS